MRWEAFKENPRKFDLADEINAYWRSSGLTGVAMASLTGVSDAVLSHIKRMHLDSITVELLERAVLRLRDAPAPAQVPEYAWHWEAWSGDWRAKEMERRRMRGDARIQASRELERQRRLLETAEKSVRLISVYRERIAILERELRG